MFKGGEKPWGARDLNGRAMMIWLVEPNCSLRKRCDSVWNILTFLWIQGVFKLRNDSDLLGNLCSCIVTLPFYCVFFHFRTAAGQK